MRKAIMMLENWFYLHAPNIVFAFAYNLFKSGRTHTLISYDSRKGYWYIIDRYSLFSLISPTPKFLSVRWKDIEEKLERHFHIREGDVVLDVGACIGDTAKYMALRTGKTGKIIAVEADALNAEYLRKNLAWHPNAIVVEKAATNHKGTEKWYKHFSVTGHSLHFATSRNVISYVETDTIDNILNGQKIDFAKIDVQESEIEALEGAHELLSSVPRILVETHDRSDLVRRTYPRVIEILESYGFACKFDMDNGIVYAQRL